MRTSAMMLGVAFVVLLGAAAAPGFASAQDAVEWRQGLSFEDALAEAQAKNTVVMVDVYATWCGPCHMLDRQVFNTPTVLDITGPLIPLKIDGETPEGEALMARYHVVGYPTVLFITPDGAEIDRVFGFLEAEPFARAVESYLSGTGTLEALEARLTAMEPGPERLELRHEVFFRHVVRGNEVRALRHAEHIREEDPDDVLRLHAALHFELGKYLYLRGSHDYALAITYFEVLKARWPESDEAAASDYPQARALLAYGQEEEAFELLQAYLDAAPESVGRYNTVAWFCLQNAVRLEFGEEVAKRGLEIDPEAAGLWDTLAELQFATGDTSGAQASIQHAIALDDDPYYAQQLERFSAP